MFCPLSASAVMVAVMADMPDEVARAPIPLEIAACGVGDTRIDVAWNGEVEQVCSVLTVLEVEGCRWMNGTAARTGLVNGPATVYLTSGKVCVFVFFFHD